MKINRKELDGELLRQEALQKSKGTQKGSPNTDASTLLNSEGTVQISNAARDLQAADLLNGDAEDNTVKINELRELVRAGKYNRSSEDIAKALLKELSAINS